MRGSMWWWSGSLFPAVLLACLVVFQSGGNEKVTLVEARAELATCEAPAKTMSFACDNKCAESVPCWLNVTASASVCTYLCYTGIYVDTTSFMFLVPFGNWTRDRMSTPVSFATLSPVGDTGNYSWANNNVLERITTMKLRSTTDSVFITGGSYVDNYYIPGQVANVELASDLLTNQTQVKLVFFRTLNLQPMISKLAGMMPPSVDRIALNNVLLEQFPPGFENFTLLNQLYLNYNNITKVDASMALDTISELDLTANQIQSFNAVFPNLTVLGLSANQLTEIPYVVMKHTHLEGLSLNNNSISEVTQSHEMQTLKILNVFNNRITRFEAYFPNLETLDIGSNKLTEIPPVIFTHTKLADLRLDDNKFENVSLTNEQATFLANLANFTFDEQSINKECYVAEQRDIHGYKFCITDSPPPDPTEEGGSSLPIIIGVVGGVVVLGIVVGVIVFRYRIINDDKHTNTYAEGTVVSANSTNNGAGVSSLWNDPTMLSIKVDAEDIKDIRRIGKGVSADVWLVKYRKSQLLASKRLRKGEGNESRVQDFIAEIKIVAKLDHPKIVTFIGAAWTIEADLQALFEYMEGGDLRHYLEHSTRIWTREKVEIAIDVIEALVYVHSFAPPLVHRDLKSRNILLSEYLEAKLTDFGVSRYRSENNTMTAGVGTGRWLAPEVILGKTDYGPAADIFSFGVVLCELDTHTIPYDEVVGPNGNRLADVALLQLISTGEMKPSMSASCPEKIKELANRCCAFDPASRPMATEIAYALRTFERDMVAML